MADIYLSAPYRRKKELRTVKSELICLGHRVTARWLDEEDSIVDDGVSVGTSPESSRDMAIRDLEDIARSNCLICFTEPPNGAPRGGRHVEFGYALHQYQTCHSAGCRIIVIGYRENIFHYLHSVEYFSSWERCAATLWREAGRCSHCGAPFTAWSLQRKDSSNAAQ